MERRRLILQDTLALFALTIITILIAVLTYFFFQSFSQHRRVLERRWYLRGEKAMSAGKPQFAVEDFRSALALSAANPQYQLALAEALAAANRTEEAYTYFSSLHDAQPGDGYLNLQLARLAIKRKEPNQAIGFYRAALTGLWHGMGAEERFKIRLELARYLMSLDRNTEAQGDLLTAEGNSLDHPLELMEVAALLRQAGDNTDALTTYRRIERNGGAPPKLRMQALQAEADAAEAVGQYKRAAQALERYMARARAHRNLVKDADVRAAENQLARLRNLMTLIPFYGLPPAQHAARIRADAQIAHARLTACMNRLNPNPTPNGTATPVLAPADQASLAQLNESWQQMASIKPANLAGDPAEQTALMDWVDQTEQLTARLCGTPTGNNALLLQLATTPDKTE
jgi:tetratricopeptide (TPR) repeat protein